MSSPVTPAVRLSLQKKKSSNDFASWQSKSTTVLSRTSFLFNTPEMSDVKFIFKTKEGTEDTIIYGHKVILAMASTVFEKMFFNQNPDFLTPVRDKVEMKDYPFTAEAFSTFMKFLYTDKINYVMLGVLPSELMLGILNCADYYDVPYLKTDCIKQLGSIFTITNVIRILEVAILFREYGLARSALAFMNKNLKFVLQSEEFLNMKMETLFVILSQDSLDLDECFVLDLALMWAEHECKRKYLVPTVENKRKVLGPVFLEIRFGLLTSDRISELVTSNFLTLEESLDICLSVHNPGHLTRTSTTPGGSKFRRNAPDVTFESKPRVFGQKMELIESRKMEEIWKKKLDHWKSLGLVQANLLMQGFPSDKTEFELREEIEQAGFYTDLYVLKLSTNYGIFHVKFLYNPSVYEFSALLDPFTFAFINAGTVLIREWEIIR